ncbi:MAG TPA: peptidylprolyl isomerase [Bryobacteraceae bacterium]|nr:peptidylprolyl isomerase [Bryobacteraceae bacterium]
MRRQVKTLVCAAALLMLAGCSSQPAATAQTKNFGPAPNVFQVILDTTKGPVVIEVHRDWAPIGVDHFYALVKAGYYDGDRFFRVVPGFVVQFGISGDPAATAKWKDMNLTDDPVKESNTVGTVTYATAGPNTRTTQLFINLGNNARLDGQGFAPFGKVISGMDAVMKIYSGYGESPDQSQIEGRGDAYLHDFPMLDYIKKATVQ